MTILLSYLSKCAGFFPSPGMVGMCWTIKSSPGECVLFWCVWRANAAWEKAASQRRREKGAVVLLWGWKSPKSHPPHQTQSVLVMVSILQLLRGPFLISGTILMGCKTLGTCALPSGSWTLLCDLCHNKLIYVFSQWVPTVCFLLASITAHNNI